MTSSSSGILSAFERAMRTEDKNRLDRLLSGGQGPSVQEKESMLAEILRQAASKPEKSPWNLVSGKYLVPAVALTIVFLVAFFPLLFLRKERRTYDEFTARGAGSSRALMQLACISGKEKRPIFGKSKSCHYGDTLLFRLYPSENARYFSAVALGADGLLVWYFPSDTKSSLPIIGEGIAREGIVIGSEHAPEEYRVFGLFSDRPLSRVEVRSLVESIVQGRETSVELIQDGFLLEK